MGRECTSPYTITTELDKLLTRIIELEPIGFHQITEQINLLPDIDLQIMTMEKILSIFRSPNRSSDSRGKLRQPHFEVVYLLTNNLTKRNPDISLAEVEKRIDLSGEHMIKQIDLDGDGQVEIFWGVSGPGCDASNIALSGSGGKVKFLKFGYSWGTQLVRTYDITGTGNKALLFMSAGGNGAGISQMFLLGLDKDGFKELFITPSSSGEGIHFIDMDRDGEDEIVCNETIEYKTLYWPRIYKWNGNTFAEASLDFPRYLIDIYKRSDYIRQDSVDYLLQERSESYRAFWIKYIKPIKASRIVK